MAKKPDEDSDQPKKLSLYTIKLDDTQMESLRAFCESRNWASFEVAYTRFAYKADHLKLNLTAYTSGKLVIAGKSGLWCVHGSRRVEGGGAVGGRRSNGAGVGWVLTIGWNTVVRDRTGCARVDDGHLRDRPLR